jgi:hypothetical protein
MASLLTPAVASGLREVRRLGTCPSSTNGLNSTSIGNTEWSGSTRLMQGSHVNVFYTATTFYDVAARDAGRGGLAPDAAIAKALGNIPALTGGWSRLGPRRRPPVGFQWMKAGISAAGSSVASSAAVGGVAPGLRTVMAAAFDAVRPRLSSALRPSPSVLRASRPKIRAAM